MGSLLRGCGRRRKSELLFALALSLVTVTYDGLHLLLRGAEVVTTPLLPWGHFLLLAGGWYSWSVHIEAKSELRIVGHDDAWQQ